MLNDYMRVPISKSQPLKYDLTSSSQNSGVGVLALLT